MLYGIRVVRGPTDDEKKRRTLKVEVDLKKKVNIWSTYHSHKREQGPCCGNKGLHGIPQGPQTLDNVNVFCPNELNSLSHAQKEDQVSMLAPALVATKK